MHKKLSSLIALVRRETYPNSNLTPYERFTLACRRNEIEVQHGHIISGFYVYMKNRPSIIGLGRDLIPTHRDFVAFHELGHHFLGEDEFSANFFAFLALSPSQNLSRKVA